MENLTKMNAKPWWEEYELKNREEQYFVIVIHIDYYDNNGKKVSTLCQNTTFDYDGEDGSNWRDATKFYNRLIEEFVNGYKLNGLSADAVSPDSFDDKRNKTCLTMLDFYACDTENNNVLYFLDSLDDWWFQYNFEINSLNQDDIIIDWGEPPFGSLAWEIQSN